MMVTSMWALTDFTADNGGTRFVPGSHRFAHTPESPDAPINVDVCALEMPAGSVMVFHGSLWHAGGANVTADDRRLGVNVQYCPGFVRQQQNPYLGIPPEIAATFSDRLLELLGYRLYKGIMGHIDGASPGESCSAIAWPKRRTNAANTSAEPGTGRRPGASIPSRSGEVPGGAVRRLALGLAGFWRSSATARRSGRAAARSGPSAPRGASWLDNDRP